MKELFSLIRKLDFKGLFFRKTDNVPIQFFRYCFVGGVATLVEFGVLVLMQQAVFGNPKEFIFLFISQGVSFVMGLLANFILSKLFVFQEKSDKTNAAGEFAAYGVIGLTGLGIKWLLQWVFNTCLGIHYVLVWLFATAVVLIWNYGARKLLLYRKKK